MADARHSGRGLMKFSLSGRERERKEVRERKKKGEKLNWASLSLGEPRSKKRNKAAQFLLIANQYWSLMSSDCYVGDMLKISTFWQPIERWGRLLRFQSGRKWEGREEVKCKKKNESQSEASPTC